MTACFVAGIGLSYKVNIRSTQNTPDAVLLLIRLIAAEGGLFGRHFFDQLRNSVQGLLVGNEAHHPPVVSNLTVYLVALLTHDALCFVAGGSQAGCR